MEVKVCLLLAASFVAFAKANLISAPIEPCYPAFNPRPNCLEKGVEGWLYWESMQYKYFPKQLTKFEAENFCKDWDEEICLGEDDSTNQRFRAHLGSFFSSGEVENALLAARRAACITQGDHFWLGARKRSDGKLVYTDRRQTSKNTFPSGNIPSLDEDSDCVAMNANTGEMVVTPCNTRLSFVCKIQPLTSH